jgi:GNAT superfamily N-acetyltransferase
MGTGIEIAPAREIPPDLQRAYLDSLAEPSELYQQNQVRRGRAFLIRVDGETVGYAAFDADTMVELYLCDSALTRGEELFDAALATAQATAAVCQTFDALMLTLALRSPAKVRVGGHLFRRCGDVDFQADPSIAARLAIAADAPGILDVDDFWSDRQELAGYIAVGGAWVYEHATAGLLGCGVITRVVEGRSAMDVGMMVAPAHRRRGYGAYIIRHLKAHVVAQGLRPIAGCAADNLGSRRTLERAGFVRSHAILDIDY